MRGDSGFIQAETRRASIQELNDRASDEYPAIVIPEGFRLHVYAQGGRWHVWLNTEAGDFDGLCLATDCDTKAQAESVATVLFKTFIRALR